MARFASRWLAGALVAASLTVVACHDSDEFLPTEPRLNTFLELVSASGATSLPADGISRLGLIARISPESDLANRTIVFSTSAGTLVGGRNGDSAGDKEVDADSTGAALIELQSSNQVQDVVVQARVKAVSGLTRQLVIAFVDADPNAVIRFVASPATAPADGASLSAFTVQISSSLPLGTPVDFTTTLGQFANGSTSTSIPTDASFRATADLVSHDAIGSSRIRATANGVTRETTIDFNRAFPNRITTLTGAAQVSATADANVTVTGTFLRDVGKVTAGTVATFSATDDAGNALGSFRNIQVVGQTVADQASADFFPGATTFRGVATITVSTAGSGVTGTATVEVID